MIPRWQEEMSEIVQDLFAQIDRAEAARAAYAMRRPNKARSHMEATVEARARLREMRYSLKKIATNRYLTGRIPEPMEDQDVLLEDTEEFRFYLEGFYNSAWRLIRCMEFLLDEDWPFDGVSMVRNKLIEHCQDGELKNSPLLINSISYDAIHGPKLKGPRWADQAGEQSKFHDSGLYVIADQFLKRVIERFERASVTSSG
jgi:hypothetical protein